MPIPCMSKMLWKRELSSFWYADDTLASPPPNHRDESEFTSRIVTCNFLYLNADQPWLIYFTPLLHSRRFRLGLQPAQEPWWNICNGAALLKVRSALSVDPFRSSLTHKLYSSNSSSRLPKIRVCRRAVFSNTSVCPAAPLSNYSLSPSFVVAQSLWQNIGKYKTL